MPKGFVQSQWDDKGVVADHWRALAKTAVIQQLKQNLTALQTQVNKTELELSCHGAAWCSSGLFYGVKCESENSSDCAVLLTDYPGKCSFSVCIMSGGW